MSKLNFKWFVFCLLICIFNDLLFLKKIAIAEEIKYENYIPIYNGTNLLKNRLLRSYISDSLKNSKSPFISLIVNNSIYKNDETSSKNIESNKKIENSLDIESNTQYEKDNIFYAEGDVVISISNAKIYSDKVSYDKNKKQIVIENNVIFKKGSQYFEAAQIIYNFKNEKGFIKNIYGLLDLKDINNDLGLQSFQEIESEFNKDYKLEDLEYINSATLGLVNDFEKDKRFNLTDLSLEIPSANRWRFKSNKLIIESGRISSNNILFTNDAFNKPQLVLKSKKFIGEINNKKLKIVSRKTSVIFDEIFSVPIGKRTISEKESITKLFLGSDYKEKDGVFLAREFGSVNIFKDYEIRLRPYILLQRGYKGYTNAFSDKNSSILSNKVRNNNSFLDLFALDTKVSKRFSAWNFDVRSTLNSLNIDRFSEANRTKINLTRTINLNESSEKQVNKSSGLNQNILDNEFDLLTNKKILNNNDGENFTEDNIFNNRLDLQMYGVYREKVFKGYSGDQEIYIGFGSRIANRKSWLFDDKKTDLSFIYDLGKFKAEKKNIRDFDTLSRNVFAIKYSYLFPLWKKDIKDRSISKSFKYTPSIIGQGIYWITSIDSGLFFYGNGSNQRAISTNAGPKLIFGELKRNFLDYTSIDFKISYVIKEGNSPFKFDNINDSTRAQVNLQQQVIGPLLFGYKAYLNLDPDHPKYGEISKGKYTLDISRRAYSIGAFYNSASESVGVKFNIFNFDYSGISPKF